jgi:hypothetical protein
VLNYVSQGTIEHGMLSLLGFKKSLFSGVLDGGGDEVFLGGTRLKRFMESVDRATDNIPSAMPAENAATTAESRSISPVDAAPETVGASPASRDAALADLAATGLAFFQKLTQAMAPPVGKSAGPASATDSDRTGTGLSSLLARDEHTGRPYLKLPLPETDVLQDIANLFAKLAGTGK